MEEIEKCYCEYLAINKFTPLSSWDDFERDSITEKRKDAVDRGKGKKQWVAKSRYGYETLDDKYKFSHHTDTHKYMEEYSKMFSVANRRHKKVWKPNPGGLSYRLLNLASKRYKETDENNTEKTTSNELDCSETVNDTGVSSSNGPVTNSTPSVIPVMKAAPPLGDCYMVDDVEDAVKDECEDDDERTVAKVPLLKQLNTFFLSKNGRKRTCYTPSSTNTSNLFPHIHSNCEHASQDLGEMTAASIINYQVPTAQRRPPTTSHPRLSVQKNMENKHAMFKPMMERQKMRMFPMRIKTVTSASLSQYDHTNPALQTANHRRFNALHLRNSPPEEKGLPRTHILTAKNINRTSEPDTDSKRPVGVAPALMDLRVSNVVSKSAPGSAKSNTDHKRSLQNIVLNYGSRSLHPYLSQKPDSSSFVSDVDANFGKAELVDYSSILATNIYNN